MLRVRFPCFFRFCCVRRVRCPRPIRSSAPPTPSNAGSRKPTSPHDQSHRQRLHLRRLPRGRREVHHDQHVRRHRRRACSSPTGKAIPRRRKVSSTRSPRSRPSRSSSSSSVPTTATTRRATRRSRPASRYLIHPTSKALMGERTPPADAELVSDTTLFTLGGGRDPGALPRPRAHGRRPRVYLPRQKILFLSEIFLNRVFPAMRRRIRREWLDALTKAERDGREHLHRRPRIHRDGSRLEGRTPRLSQSDAKP